MKKARFLRLHSETNTGKVAALEALQAEYTPYLRICVAAMIAAHRFRIPYEEKQAFFPPCEKLSSQIVKIVRDHASAIVSGWAASKYATDLRALIVRKFKKGEIDESLRAALCILGKCLVSKPRGKVTQEALDLYWSWLLDEKLVGRTPTVSERCGMRMSEMTATLKTSATTKLTTWWLGFSHLDSGKARVQLPLVQTPYAKRVNDVSKGVLARKDRRGHWRFEVVDRKEWEVTADLEMPRIGLDVGMNVMVATSGGRLMGAALKPKFDALHEKVKTLRKNRQRQGFQENSPRLDRLESKLSGMVKTLAGECTNKLVAAYPGYVFVIEDLDLRGSRGSKRFALRAVHHSLMTKAPTIAVNPAFTSQPCPKCGYVSRNNRKGIVFRCRCCGKKAHADVVGAGHVLGRSWDKHITLDDHHSEVGVLLRERFRARRRTSSSGGLHDAPAPSGRRLTTEDSCESPGTASNRVVPHA